MKVTRWFTIALALAMPSTLLAQDAPKNDEETTKERSTDTDTDRDRDTPTTTTTEEKTKVDDKTMMKIKGSVVPVVAGIEAADKAVSALYELGSGGTLDPKDARSTVQLADRGIQMALSRAEALHNMKDLSDDAKSEANTAMMKLRDARTALNRLDKQVSKSKIGRNEVEQIREQARDLHTDLSDAENAVERVAKAYDISTDLEIGG